MISLTPERIRQILGSLASVSAFREVFLRESRSAFLMLGDDAQGTEFRKRLAERLSNKKWKHGLTTEQLIEVAQRLNDPAICRAVANQISDELKRRYFPELVEFAAVGTTTANTAPYAVPIGMLAPSKDRGPSYDRKKRKKKKH